MARKKLSESDRNTILDLVAEYGPSLVMREAMAENTDASCPARQLSDILQRDRVQERREVTEYGGMKTSLRAIRVKYKLTMKDVADAVGVTEGCLCKVEKGREPVISTAWRIAFFYGKRIEELWNIEHPIVIKSPSKD